MPRLFPDFASGLHRGPADEIAKAYRTFLFPDFASGLHRGNAMTEAQDKWIDLFPDFASGLHRGKCTVPDANVLTPRSSRTSRPGSIAATSSGPTTSS